MNNYEHINTKSGGTYVWHKLYATSNATEHGYGVIVEWAILGSEKSGFMVFDTKGAAYFYLGLVFDALAADELPSGEAWEIQEKYRKIAGQFSTHTHNKTEGK